MRLDELTIKSNIKDYTVYFEKNEGFLKNLAEIQNIVFIIDENVWDLHKDKSLKPLPIDKVIVQPVCEDTKNIKTVCELYEKIMEFAPRKNMTLVSIGGGIIQDITGFVASSLYRGINWIFVPTTLLAQVDSCIGAKTSLNFKHFKNLVGTFYPPSKIHIYPEFLKTLPKIDYYSGVGEMAKLHLMNGEQDTLKFIETLPGIDSINDLTVLERTQNCLKIKKSYIEDDEFDTGKRNLLNYGHCFGHAIESATDFAISHGQAVVVGMLLANEEAEKRNILSSKNKQFIKENVLLPVLKTDLSKIDFDIEKIIQAMGQDKKNIETGLGLVMIKDAYNLEKITDLNTEEAIILISEFIEKIKTHQSRDLIKIDLTGYDAIIFDMDGTLIDSSEEVLSCLQRSCESLNATINTKKITSDIIGPPLKDIIKSIIKDNKNEDLIKQINDKFRLIYDNDENDNSTMYEGTYEWLISLKKAGKRLFLATNKPKIPTKRLISKLNLKIFEDAYTIDKYSEKLMSKSEMISEIIEKYNLDKTKTIMIGDAPSDIKAAHSANIKAIGVLWGYGNHETILREISDFVMDINDLKELQKR